MLGAIIGDVVGSAYEGGTIKGRTLPLTPPSAKITDDTILIAAIAEAMTGDRDYAGSLKRWGKSHPNMGYGPGFEIWLKSDSTVARGSAGNGAAVRVIPIGWLAQTLEEAKEQARMATTCTHDHESSYRAAEAVATAIFRLRSGEDSNLVFREVSQDYDYLFDFSLDLEQLHQEHGFDSHCDTSVPIAFAIARQARSFQDAMSKGLYVGGDTDTILAIAGALREAMDPNDLPTELVDFAIGRIRRDAPDVISVLTRACPSQKFD